MLSVWYLQAPSEAGVRLHSAEELESGFGHRIRHLGQEHPTGYLLCQALRRLEPEEDAPECGRLHPAAIRRCATNVRVCDGSSFIIN